MIDPKEKIGLERLLSGGGPSRMEREDMLHSILNAPEVAAAQEAKGARLLSWFAPSRWIPIGVGVAAVAMLSFGLPSAEPDEFASRGEKRASTLVKTATGLEISASCVGKETSLTCKSVDELLLEIDVQEQRVQVGAALLSQQSATEGEVTWFFPEKGKSPLILDGGSTLQRLSINAPKGQKHFLFVMMRPHVEREDIMKAIDVVTDRAEKQHISTQAAAEAEKGSGLVVVEVQIRP